MSKLNVRTRTGYFPGGRGCAKKAACEQEIGARAECAKLNCHGSRRFNSSTSSPHRVSRHHPTCGPHAHAATGATCACARAAAVFAKLEFLNPGGSIKDRAALGMILDAEARGLLHAGSTIIEATAGNTGVGLALIGVNRGYTVKLFVPEGFAEEKCILMRGFGAEVMRTPEDEGMAGAIKRARAAGAEIRGVVHGAASFRTRPIRSFITTQPRSKSGSRWKAGSTDLWPAWARAEHSRGVARFLKEQNPAVVNVAVETEGSILQGGAPGKHQRGRHRRALCARDVSSRCVRPRGDGDG